MTPNIFTLLALALAAAAVLSCNMSPPIILRMPRRKKTVYAVLELEDPAIAELGWTELLEVEVDESAGPNEWLEALSIEARPFLPRGVGVGFLKFRFDGTNKPLTLWEKMQDVCFKVSGWGRPITGSEIVTNWT